MIFEGRRRQSQKPEGMYKLIESLTFHGARKVELFARRWNLRKDWVSLGIDFVGLMNPDSNGGGVAHGECDEEEMQAVGEEEE